MLVVTALGRRIAHLLPSSLNDSVGFYIAPLLGLAGIVLITTVYGWLSPFKIGISISLSLSVGLLLLGIAFEKQRADLFRDWLIVSAFAIVATIPILTPAIRFDSFNPFNDSFTYLAHGQWLQEHAFSEAARASGFFPAETQVVLYQGAGHRMGGLLSRLRSVAFPFGMVLLCLPSHSRLGVHLGQSCYRRGYSAGSSSFKDCWPRIVHLAGFYDEWVCFWRTIWIFPTDIRDCLFRRTCLPDSRLDRLHRRFEASLGKTVFHPLAAYTDLFCTVDHLQRHVSSCWRRHWLVSPIGVLTVLERKKSDHEICIDAFSSSICSGQYRGNSHT